MNRRKLKKILLKQQKSREKYIIEGLGGYSFKKLIIARKKQTIKCIISGKIREIPRLTHMDHIISFNTLHKNSKPRYIGFNKQYAE